MNRRALLAASLLAVSLGVRAAAEEWSASVASNLAGSFTLDGKHYSRGFFRGECTIARTSATTWSVKQTVRYASGATETRAGTGRISGESLKVSFTITPGSSSSNPYSLDASYSLRSIDVLRGVLEQPWNGWDVAVERLRRPGPGLVLIVANRQWEVKHLLATLTKSSSRPIDITTATIELIDHPVGATGYAARRPRARFRCERWEVEVWCIEDLTRAAPLVGKLSVAKWNVLEHAFAGEGGDVTKPRKPKAVIGYGSAAGTKDVPNNGSVAVGHQVFIHDPTLVPSAPDDPWHDNLDRLYSGLASKLLEDIDSVRDDVEPDFGKPPVTAGTPRLVSREGLVALSTVNVTDNDDYIWADPETVKAFESKFHSEDVGSVDTVMGLLRLRTRTLSYGSPFIYVTGVLNRMGDFEELDTDPQKATATTMTNAGRTALFLIPAILKKL